MKKHFVYLGIILTAITIFSSSCKTPSENYPLSTSTTQSVVTTIETGTTPTSELVEQTSTTTITQTQSTTTTKTTESTVTSTTQTTSSVTSTQIIVPENTGPKTEEEQWVEDLPSDELVFTPFGMMLKYYAERMPVEILVPGMMKEDYSDIWIKSDVIEEPPSYPLFQRHSKDPSSQLTITEPSFKELELSEMTLEEYVNVVVSANMQSHPDFNLISANKYELSENMTIATIKFSSEAGKRMFQRFIYIHNNGYIFNMTYAYRPAEDDIADMIEYSFATFKFTD
jgi:hypothetical protein